MKQEPFEIYVEKQQWGGRIPLKIVCVEPIVDYEKERYRVLDLSWKEVEGFHEDFPGLPLSMSQGQRLIDQLWDAGLRPSEGSGSAGSLKATQNHLQDMRATGSKLWELLDRVVKD